MNPKRNRQDATRVGKKRVRIDAAHQVRRVNRIVDDSWMLDHFRNRTPAGVPERRKSPRFEAGLNRVWLGWWKGEHEFVSTSARIVNISLGGAMLCPENPPPQDRPCWLCLGIPDPVEYVEVAILDVVASRQGQFAVRLEFREPCPYSFFKAVIDGMEPAQTEDAQPPASPPVSVEEETRAS
jgi:hypothetical protein